MSIENTTQRSFSRDVLKTCKTCGHREGVRCMKSGFYCITARASLEVCDINFSGWVPARRRRSLLKWLYDTFISFESDM